MNTAQKVGKEIRRARMDMNMSQKEFGNLVGRSESQIAAYENARCTITLDILIKIAEAAKVKPEQFFTGSEKKEEKTGWDMELRIYGLEDRKQVMTILATNGYDVGQHKRQATPTGKAVNYYVHATDRKENADTSK